MLTGSLAQEGVTPDSWSDLDLLLFVRDATVERYHPSTLWLEQVGELWAWEQPSGGRVTLARFWDFQRLDIVIRTESELEHIDEWGPRQLLPGNRVLFSRSETLDTALTRPLEPPAFEQVQPHRFETMSNKFWFACGVAVYKVVRGDLLIAAHLALEAIQDCLVLRMILRDRARGTTHHREGSSYEGVLEQVPSLSTPYTPAGILETVEQCAILFDRLGEEWSEAYNAKRQPLLREIARARQLSPLRSLG